jgi:hypothetical protein
MALYIVAKHRLLAAADMGSIRVRWSHLRATAKDSSAPGPVIAGQDDERTKSAESRRRISASLPARELPLRARRITSPLPAAAHR